MYDCIYDPEGLGLRSVNKCHNPTVSTNKSMATARGRLTLSPIPNQQIELRVSLSMWIRLVFKLESSGMYSTHVCKTRAHESTTKRFDRCIELTQSKSKEAQDCQPTSPTTTQISTLTYRYLMY